MDHREAEEIFGLVRDHFAPGAAGSVYRKAVRFCQLNRIAQPKDGYLAGTDLLRRKAVSEMRKGGPSRNILRRRFVCRTLLFTPP